MTNPFSSTNNSKCPQVIILKESICVKCRKPTYFIDFEWNKAWFHKYVEDDYDHCPEVES